MRPIDADALMERLERKKAGVANNRYTEGFNDALMRFRSMLHSEPTLDYAPVRHGEWIEKIEPYAYTASGREIHIFHCSVCDFTWANKRMVFDHFKHCPNCGAKMDGGKKDD